MVVLLLLIEEGVIEMRENERMRMRDDESFLNLILLNLCCLGN